MRFHAWFVLLAAATSSLAADTIPLWPNGAPGEKADVGPEVNTSKPSDRSVSGKPVIRLSNITNPTITIYRPPKNKNTGTAVVVCPGGAYRILAYDLEGTEVCEWLNSIGVTGVLLKYRVPPRPNQKNYEAPLQDAQRAMSLVRSHADVWQIQTNRIGILGFSAGGHLSAITSCHFEQRTYDFIDAADQFSCRPDFTVLIYPAYLIDKDESHRLAPEFTISSNVPPAFLVQTEDDEVHVENSFSYCLAFKNVHVPVELHVFAKGGHGYGLRPSANSVSTWPTLAEQWLRSSHFLQK
jgi:acetyl esterase/lipase